MVIGGDGAQAEQDPADPRCSDRPEPEIPLGLDTETPAAQLLDEMAFAGAEGVRTWQENEQRCSADQELVSALTAVDFAGPLYERFADELARYALAVLRAWMHSGEIFRRTAARGFDLEPSAEEIDQLCRDAHARDDLADIIVAKALPWFREKALITEVWRPDGGACLSTYFLGACVFFFPNELRAWRRRRRGNPLLLQNDDDLELFSGPDKASGPEAVVIGDLSIRDCLDRAGHRIRPILTLKLQGYSYEEIVELLDEASIRAVEGVVHRWRKKEQELLGGESGEQQ